MFEKRLRLFLVLIFLGGFILAVRAAQVQVVDQGHWAAEASSSAEQVSYLSPRRGDLLDFRGRVIATDAPSFEAAVNFAVIGQEPDAAWLKQEARRRARLLPAWTSAVDDRPLLLAEEQMRIRRDLEAMWDELARVSGLSRIEIDAIRQGIVEDVRAKHESIWRHNFRQAREAYEASPENPWYIRWIAGERKAPAEENYRKDVIGEQVAFHTILPDLTTEQYNELALGLDRWPQRPAGISDGRRVTASILRLRPAVHRTYPWGDVAAHVIGRVAAVSAEDRAADPNKGDELRSYRLNDRIGREGMEALAEHRLRGLYGQKVTDRRGASLFAEAGTPGADVRTTIDIELQRAIQEAFKAVVFRGPDKDAAGHPIDETLSMNGAAVVIDVPTGQVRALVSVPTYDVNRFDALYLSFLEDLNRPLMNRALQDTIEPGSTVKPIVGVGAVTQGLIGVDDTVECIGYPVIEGRQLAKPRCWTMSMYGRMGLGDHHRVPTGAEHPTGRLNLTDAIERSCNVYFITEGHKLGIEGLSYWMKKFGFGRITGIGLPENRGLVPSMAKIAASDRPSSTWYASIGQGPVNVTPIQIANEFATLARDGVWMKPKLFVDPMPAAATTRPSPADEIPDRVDLKLDPAAVRAVHEGMIRVVNSDAGTGRHLYRDDVTIAGKTGSATAAPLVRILRAPDGKPLLDDNGNVRYERIPYGTRERPNRELPWYRLSGYDEQGRPVGTHSWVAGYAPAENPQVAFVVFVEYGGSGGVGAASVAQRLLQACIDQGYLRTRNAPAKPLPPTIARPAM